MHEYQYIHLTWHLFLTGVLFYLLLGFHLVEYVYLLAWVMDAPVMTTAVLLFHTFVMVRGYRVWKGNNDIHPEEWKRIMFFLLWYMLDVIAICMLQHHIFHGSFAWGTVLFFLVLTGINVIYYARKKYLFWLEENMTE